MATAAATVARKLFYHSTPAQPKVPPLFEVCGDQIGTNTSPADSTLTPAITKHHSIATGTSFAGLLDGFDQEAYDNALADEVIDNIIFDDYHDEKVASNPVLSTPELDDLDKENEDEQGGDSDGDGEEADLHNIALFQQVHCRANCHAPSWNGAG